MSRLALLLVVLVVAGCAGSGDEESSGDDAAASQLADLTSVDQFKERFNADQGVPRLVVLLAPT